MAKKNNSVLFTRLGGGMSAGFIVLVTFSLMTSSPLAKGNIDLVLQKNTASYSERYNIQAGYCFKLKKPKWVYYESGAMISVPFDRTAVKAVTTWDTEQEFTQSMFGFYGGAFFYFAPIFRPGLQVGTAIEKRFLYRGQNEANFAVREMDYSVHPYVGVAAHIGILSLIYSTHGYGAGVNLWFK